MTAVAAATLSAMPFTADALGPDDTESVPASSQDTETPSELGVYERIAILIESYEWDERAPRVETLQAVLGVLVDGWYGPQTARAHRGALEFLGAPTDDLPEPAVPSFSAPAGWAALRDCESGGDYTITNPSGKYRGAYQFDQSTWDSVAGRHAPHLVGTDPAAAAPADQDAVALALYHEAGASPWPHCGRHLR